jgi:glycerate-2-kinase
MAPCAFIAAGENVVMIGSSERGIGGPNQEFALSAGIEVAGLDDIVIASIDTDGFDTGPTGTNVNDLKVMLIS